MKINSIRKPKFYEWDGKTIHVTGKKEKISTKYCDEKKREWIKDETVTPNELDSNYSIGVFNAGSKTFVRAANDSEMKGVLNTKFLYLVMTANNLPVIINYKNLNTPEYITINGNYSMTSQHHAFNSRLMTDAIKNSFRPSVEQQLRAIRPNEYPIRILFEIHDTIKNHADKDNYYELGNSWDIENRASFYIKAVTDLLKECNIIIDDDRLYVTQPPAPIFVPVEHIKESKLIFHLQTDDRECIISNPIYQKIKKGELK